jgi:S-adenosylmethionine decarboxylase
MMLANNDTNKGALGRRPDGVQYAGTHLFVDMWGAKNTDDKEAIRLGILQAVEDSGATLLKMDLSDFGEHAGVTAFAILAESHICVNTWFEEQMVAIDVFFCAGLDPHLCLPALQAVFQAERVQVSEHKRLMASPLTHEKSLL